MKKDHTYYEGRIIKASQSLHQRLTQGRTADEIYDMLDRLHWITSEEFGEDLEEWKSWMAAFEENPPVWGGR